MRIGLMLRHLGRQPGGTGTYTNMMVSHMLAADRNNEYVLLYDDPARLQSYTAQPMSRKSRSDRTPSCCGTSSSCPGSPGGTRST
jgi:hypothetical protein